MASGFVYLSCVFHSLLCRLTHTPQPEGAPQWACSKSWWVGVEVRREQMTHQYQEATVVTEGALHAETRADFNCCLLKKKV